MNKLLDALIDISPADLEDMCRDLGMSEATSDIDLGTYCAAYDMGYYPPNYTVPAIKYIPCWFSETDTIPHAIVIYKVMLCPDCDGLHTVADAVWEFDISQAREKFIAVGEYTNRRMLDESLEFMMEFMRTGGRRQ